MDKFYYITLDVLSFLIPFLFSFETKRMHFIRHYNSLFKAIIIIGLFFVAWDIYFAYTGIWSFNPRYLLGFNMVYLPIEEWLFFILIPYSSVFIHYSIVYFFPKLSLAITHTARLNVVLFLIAFLVFVFNLNKIYTAASFGLFSLLMLLQIIFKWSFLRVFYISFMIILIPFLLVNSALTGLFTPEAVVMYDDSENLGIRIGRIPIEDFFYCFSLIYSIVLLFEKLKKKQGHEFYSN